ncbi:uncharacterized protein BO97DRAFT_417426 [Aspergillus homomorphus CBS 101889]|uniref:Uncharacterized protein n=1 Tax=Aspergillus homomorphus (strain CBS 101889) TaxID=1450537 RepID=A0A395HMA6_ASPHC|nr:hypothetical protein BO97DRAFT_417426 [Aspergillus homomorphus CBS 101889]RAL08756.1 hypothetical protein BO97DRAFT_417426 [Aspergillus homomorphus CBS 101889]
MPRACLRLFDHTGAHTSRHRRWVEEHGSSRDKISGVGSITTDQGRTRPLDESISAMKSLKAWVVQMLNESRISACLGGTNPRKRLTTSNRDYLLSSNYQGRLHKKHASFLWRLLRQSSARSAVLCAGMKHAFSDCSVQLSPLASVVADSVRMVNCRASLLRDGDADEGESIGWGCNAENA